MSRGRFSFQLLFSRELRSTYFGLRELLFHCLWIPLKHILFRAAQNLIKETRWECSQESESKMCKSQLDFRKKKIYKNLLLPSNTMTYKPK